MRSILLPLCFLLLCGLIHTKYPDYSDHGQSWEECIAQGTLLFTQTDNNRRSTYPATQTSITTPIFSPTSNQFRLEATSMRRRFISKPVNLQPPNLGNSIPWPAMEKLHLLESPRRGSAATRNTPSTENTSTWSCRYTELYQALLNWALQLQPEPAIGHSTAVQNRGR